MLESTDDLVYSCLDLNPKAVSQLQDETGLPSGSLLKSLYYLTAKDLAREVWQNYYIRTEKRWHKSTAIHVLLKHIIKNQEENIG